VWIPVRAVADPVSRLPIKSFGAHSRLAPP
jgi:hypothetical protein